MASSSHINFVVMPIFALWLSICRVESDDRILEARKKRRRRRRIFFLHNTKLGCCNGRTFQPTHFQLRSCVTLYFFFFFICCIFASFYCWEFHGNNWSRRTITRTRVWNKLEKEDFRQKKERKYVFMLAERVFMCACYPTIITRSRYTHAIRWMKARASE